MGYLDSLFQSVYHISVLVRPVLVRPESHLNHVYRNVGVNSNSTEL